MRGAEALRLGVASRPLDQIEHWPQIFFFPLHSYDSCEVAL